MPPSGSHNVHLPSRDQPWHWGFHSCSGFSLSVTQAEWGGVAPLWNDLLQQHQASPIHLVVGGGDQLYNDALFKVSMMLRCVIVNCVAPPNPTRMLNNRLLWRDKTCLAHT